MIVDAHCHAGTGGNRMTGPWDTAAPLDRYLARCDAAGIERSVLIPVFHTDYAVANREVGRIARQEPARFWAFCMVHPLRDRGRIDSLVREAVEQHDARGIKVHRGDAPITREVCDAGRRYRLPILYDVMAQPAQLDLVAPAYRDLTFIIPHLGSFSDDWKTHQTVIDQMGRHPNLIVDTSGVRRFDYLVVAVRRHGPDRVVFGSDGPWLHPGLELAKIRLLGLRPEAEQAITGGTILRILEAGRSRVHQPRDRSPRGSKPAGAEVRVW